MKSETTTQVWHDRLAAIVMRETRVELSATDRERATVALDMLCWVLDHKHNRTAELALARLLADLHMQKNFAYCGRCHVFHIVEETKALAELEKWGAENTIEGEQKKGDA